MVPKLCVSLLFCSLMFSLSCSSGGPKSAEDALDQKGALDVIEQAGEEEYTPPEDGRITADQVAMYIKVREREIELLEVASKRFKESADKANEAQESGSKLSSLTSGLAALKNLSDVLTTDIRAAQELGVNSEEYQWVKQQILMADMIVQGAELEKRVAKMSQEQGQEAPAEVAEDADVQAARYNLELIGDQKDHITELNQKAIELQQKAN